MTHIYALCSTGHDKLHLWRDAARDGGPQPTSEAVDRGLDDRGLRLFDLELDAQQHQPAHFKIHGGPDDQQFWERDEHTKTVPRTANYEFPEVLYCVEGAARVLTQNPFDAEHERVTVHLVTARRLRGGQLWYWSPGVEAQPVTASRVDEYGPVFELDLSGAQRHWFSFKFVAADGTPEPEFANRLWCAQDGAEIWVHSLAAAVSSTPPSRVPLRVCTLPFIEAPKAQLHLWQEDSDFIADLDATVAPDGSLRFESLVYADRPYRFMFRSRAGDYWEDDEAQRNVFLSSDGAVWTVTGDGNRRQVSKAELWTLDGDHELFGARPQRKQQVVVSIAARDPAFSNGGPLTLDVWVNHARTKLYEALAPDADGRWYFQTYSEVVTSFVFRAGGVREPIERHTVKIDEDDDLPTTVYVVLGRADALPRAPIPDLFADPPFELHRPGAWLDNGSVHFVLHCPTAACVEVIGEWTNWERHPIPLRSTRDGTFFWGRIDASSITGPLGRTSIHGVGYKFLINQQRFVQDPAADWVENSAPSSQSQLVDHGSYQWRSNGWQRPGWEYLIVYQAHPNGFADQNQAVGFDAITRELTADDGYLRGLGATALLLLPVAEYAMDYGWGYNPSFFYAVESSYGGPDALKRLVDACHERGLAVLVDVVFNHAGTGDNALWAVASKSYFDGDTEWGAMINFDHPQVIHFFEQNL
ncbi:MAG TPA: alpha-amylase family glycosyl hydrolase, partial [Polyangiaceae bacterium]|nr:alpha-amylase family glycosyl hydrolase [Polyangiaceae bacterium]